MHKKGKKCEGNIGHRSGLPCARQYLLKGKEKPWRVEEHMKLKVLLVLIGSVQIAECSAGKWQVK